MKKLLISLTILFSLFFGLNSVSAEELNTSNLFNYVHFTNLYGLTDDEMLSLGNSVNVDLTDFVKNYNIHKQKATLKNFVFRYENGMGVTIFYKSNDTWTLNLKDNSTYYVVYVEDRNTTSKVSVKYNTWSSTTLYSPSQSAYSLGQINNIKKDVAKEYYFFYISDLENDLYLKYTTSLNGSGYLTSDIIIDSNIYSINEITPINLKTGYHSLKEDKPKLTYKTGFVSSEAYSVLGKVSVDFSETDKNIYKYKTSQFKLQFGANDFAKGNIPVFSHYKVFGKRNNTWTELSEEDLKIPYAQDSDGNTLYDDRTLNVIDTTYDYSEGMLADASITLQINYSNLIDTSVADPIYTDWKIEFYFDNTQNGYIYVYDTLDSSKWTDTSKFLEDYIYYYFPTNYKYAFITSEKSQNDGRIYFPTNSANNDLIKLQGQYYNLSNKTFSRSVPSFVYDQDNYYSYFDFSFNDSQNLLVMNRILGSVTYENWYNPTFLESWHFLTGPLYWGTLTSVSENSYFYVPIGYKVYFTNDTNINVITSQGSITIDINNSRNDYESKSDIFNIFSSEANLVEQVFKPFLETWNATKTYTGIFNYILIVVIGSIVILLIKSKR